MVEVASSKNATLGAFSPPEQREGARWVQSPEAMAIANNMANNSYLLLPRSVGNFAVANAIYGSCVFVCQVVHQGVYR